MQLNIKADYCVLKVDVYTYFAYYNYFKTVQFPNEVHADVLKINARLELEMVIPDNSFIVKPYFYYCKDII